MRGPGVLDMVVEKCSFYDVFLKVVFKKHVNSNDKSLFVISERKKKNELIAGEINSFEKVRMKEGGKNIDFSWEVMKSMKKGSDFSREVLKFIQKY